MLRTSCISSSVILRKEMRQAGNEIASDSLPLIVSSAHYVWLRDISRARSFVAGFPSS